MRQTGRIYNYEFDDAVDLKNANLRAYPLSF
jgi:hypothetical protein